MFRISSVEEAVIGAGWWRIVAEDGSTVAYACSNGYAHDIARGLEREHANATTGVRLARERQRREASHYVIDR